jgi:hypothetical protein
MWLLAAAISPGNFGFTDWACAAEALSAIATHKNNALIIIPPSHSLILAADRAIAEGSVPDKGQGKAVSSRPYGGAPSGSASPPAARAPRAAMLLPRRQAARRSRGV